MSVGLVATDSGPGPDILMRRYFAIRHRAPGLRNNGLVIGVREDNSIALLELIFNFCKARQLILIKS